MADPVLGTNGDDDVTFDQRGIMYRGLGGKDTIRAGNNAIAHRFDGGAGNDTLHGGDVIDWLNGGDGADTLFGNGGDDWLIGGPGNDTIDGGDGNDAVHYTHANGAVAVTLPEPAASNKAVAVGADQGTDTLISIEDIVGSTFGDTLKGNSVANRIHGGSGNDRIEGLGGDDILVGGHHSDTIFGGEGNDLIDGDGGARCAIKIDDGNLDASNLGPFLFAGDDKLYGGGGNDRIYGGLGNDEIDGGDGDDEIWGDAYGVISQINYVEFDQYFLDIQNGRTEVKAIQWIPGTELLLEQAGDDVPNINWDYVHEDELLQISTNFLVEEYYPQDNSPTTTYDLHRVLDDTGEGATGHVVAGIHFRLKDHNPDIDLFQLWGVNDVLVGGAGNDIIHSDGGADQISGGTGIDTLYFNRIRATANLTVDISNPDWISGVVNDGSLLYSMEILYARTGSGNDTLVGWDLDDRLAGGLGTDTLRGGGGNDIFEGTAAELAGDTIVDFSAGDIIRLLGGATLQAASLSDGGTILHFTVHDTDYSLNLTAPAPNIKFTDTEITWAPFNNAPDGIVLSGGSILEDAAAGTVVGSALGSDPDAGDTLTYALSDDAGGRFVIDETSGAITVASGAVFDHETEASVSIKVKATDAGGLSFEKVFAIAVGDVNEAPSDIALSNLSVQENAAGATVGTLTVVDPDAGDTHDYTASDDRFEVVGGELRLKAVEELDFESEPTVAVTVRATDAGGLFMEKVFTIAVGDANDAPGDITLSNLSVQENAAGATVGTLTVVDPDAGDTHVYIVDDDRFEVVGGELKLKDGEALDHETEASVAVNVTATDAGGLSFEKTFTIAVDDVYESTNAAPDDIVLSNATLLEDAAAGTVMGSALGSDPDAGDTLTYALSDDAGGRFVIDETSGAITVASGAVFDHETEASVSIKVKATDAGGLSFEKVFAIAVGNVNEAPTVVTLVADQSVNEDTAWSFVLPADVFSDPDGDTLTLSATLGDGSALPGWLGFNAGTRTFEGTPPQDFNGVIDLKVTASDGTASVSDSFTLTVNPVNDAPVGAPTADLPDGLMLENYTISEADLLVGFSDPDGDTLHVVGLTSNRGTLTDNGDGTWTWVPPLVFTGGVELSYQVSDGIAAPVDATQSFDIVQPSAPGAGGKPPATVIEDTSGNDLLSGTSGNDVFRPLEGDDDIFGGSGDDSVILPGDTDGYVFVQLANGRIGVLDIDPSDGDQGAKVLDGVEYIRFGDADADDTPLAGLIDMEQPAWMLEQADVALVAAVWQLFMGGLPSAQGFEYLILSDINPTDLNDPYYAPFNTENIYLNFATGYATGNPAGAAWFDREFGGLTYEEAVEKAFDLIITDAALLAAGSSPESSRQFFLDAQSYFEQIAAARIVPEGVELGNATKMALLGSMLYEAVRSDIGPYAEAVNDFAEQVARIGMSTEFLHDLLGTA